MGEGEKGYREGFAAGWLAASQAIMTAMMAEQPPAKPELGFAGSLPSGARRRGRPPKSMSIAQAALSQPVKRRRGRPRKTT